MSIMLFSVGCLDCQHEFLSTSAEHLVCPNCEETSLRYDGILKAAIEAPEQFQLGNLDLLLEDQELLWVAILIANAYLAGAPYLARSDEQQGVRLALYETDFLTNIANLLGCESLREFERYVLNHIEEPQDKLLNDPILPIIERHAYTDEEGIPYEMSSLDLTVSRKIWYWFRTHEAEVYRALSQDSWN